MENKYYEYIGTKKQSDGYANPIPVLGNIYPDSAQIGLKAVSFWADGLDSISKEWMLVKNELSTHELIELLNKQAAKDGMTCTVTFENKPGIEITDFEVKNSYFKGVSVVSFLVNIENKEVQIKQPQLIEAIKRELEND